MTTDRQRAANRRNAAKSSGPRSPAGRRRASRNSYRHGLAASNLLNADRARRVEKLAREFAGDSADPLILDRGRAAAQAKLDIDQVRRAKVATINQILVFGQLAPAEATVAEVKALERILRCAWSGGATTGILPFIAPPLPSAEPERTAEAIRRALPELIKLDRYEHSAVLRHERAMRAIYARRTQKV